MSDQQIQITEELSPDEFLADMANDYEIAKLFSCEVNTIRARRCRGTWPLKTYHILRKPHSSRREAADYIRSTCIKPDQDCAA